MFSIVSFTRIPVNAGRSTQAIYPSVGLAVGLIGVHVAIFLFHLVRAPYAQRNEAWNALETLGASLKAPTLQLSYRDCQWEVAQRDRIARIAGDFVPTPPMSVVRFELRWSQLAP